MARPDVLVASVDHARRSGADALAARRRPRRPRTGSHHMHVYRLTESCWAWDCPCGGGVHVAAEGLQTQHAAFIAALDHANRNPGA